MLFILQPLVNGTFICDNIKRLITFNGDYIKRLSLYYKALCLSSWQWLRILGLLHPNIRTNHFIRLNKLWLREARDILGRSKHIIDSNLIELTQITLGIILILCLTENVNKFAQVVDLEILLWNLIIWNKSFFLNMQINWSQFYPMN